MKINKEDLFAEEDVADQLNGENFDLTKYDDKPEKLTSDNLSRMDEKSRTSKKSKASKKSKPAWATTEKQLEDEKEAEIDDLLEFAYELDYDKYMGDFEIR